MSSIVTQRLPSSASSSRSSTNRGQIIASQIEVKGSSSELKDDVAEYEFHGQLSELTDNSFMLRGYRIGYDPAILEPGLMLENGLYVEVKAEKANGLLQAVEIEAED